MKNSIVKSTYALNDAAISDIIGRDPSLKEICGSTANSFELTAGFMGKGCEMSQNY